ncbi:threonine aldolase family protein [Peptoniphilus stercorisuis]|uniref:Threonine aldolase n=1 Tax=Peptoniphilus stercorisuis TaxID=1436965 RepID=A0ABS4KA10_9FIRM|nr:aminotransferase class V-fold PLP-dependent enzyme [Peptoniphilus stercorisuis]MBP2024607.1 threonine aldolase [Peptoniphilus stercorisuis]
MNIFLNDYNDLCHENVYQKVSEVQEKGNIGYGFDEYSEKAKRCIKRDLENKDVQIEFLAGGTIANIIAISANLLPYEGVIAAKSGHIVGHETGSIEATGHKVELIETSDGKLSKDLLLNRLKDFTDEYHIVPKLVYISQTTELGTVYSYEEIKEIYDVCLEYGLYLYIDGARMAVGLAASDIEVSDLCDICDIFTLGGTKNGAMFGEALVIVEEELKHNLRNFMRQRGSVIAKGFITGAQFLALFEDGLYYELGKKANDMSIKLAEELEKINIKFNQEPVSNQIFIEMPIEKIKPLEENNAFEIQPLSDSEKVLRFVTSYRTNEEEINGLISDLKALED